MVAGGSSSPAAIANAARLPRRRRLRSYASFWHEHAIARLELVEVDAGVGLPQVLELHVVDLGDDRAGLDDAARGDHDVLALLFPQGGRGDRALLSWRLR